MENEHTVIEALWFISRYNLHIPTNQDANVIFKKDSNSQICVSPGTM